MKCIEQGLPTCNNRVDHQFMTALGEYCRHLIGDKYWRRGTANLRRIFSSTSCSDE